MSPTFHQYYEGKWSNVFDGVYFIDEMEPDKFDTETYKRPLHLFFDND